MMHGKLNLQFFFVSFYGNTLRNMGANRRHYVYMLASLKFHGEKLFLYLKVKVIIKFEISKMRRLDKILMSNHLFDKKEQYQTFFIVHLCFYTNEYRNGRNLLASLWL